MVQRRSTRKLWVSPCRKTKHQWSGLPQVVFYVPGMLLGEEISQGEVHDIPKQCKHGEIKTEIFSFAYFLAAFLSWYGCLCQEQFNYFWAWLIRHFHDLPFIAIFLHKQPSNPNSTLSLNCSSNSHTCLIPYHSLTSTSGALSLRTEDLSWGLPAHFMVREGIPENENWSSLWVALQCCWNFSSSWAWSTWDRVSFLSKLNNWAPPSPPLFF